MLLANTIMPLALAFGLGTVTASCQSSKTGTDSTDTATPAELELDQRSDATPGERAERQTAYLTQRLELRDDQVDDVREIALESARARADLRGSGDGDRRAMTRALREIRDDQSAKLRGVLDGAQYDEYEVIQEELRTKMKERARERRG